MQNHFGSLVIMRFFPWRFWIAEMRRFVFVINKTSKYLYQNLREESPFSYSLESCSQYTACLVVEIFFINLSAITKEISCRDNYVLFLFFERSVLSSSVCLYVLGLHKLKGDLEKLLRAVHCTLQFLSKLELRTHC